MSLALLAGIGLVGGLGATARFLLDGSIAGRLGRRFPWGTLAVNVLGAFLAGVAVGAALDEDLDRLLELGLLGAFTTFSTWALESHRLAEDGQMRLGAVNFALSLGLGIAAVALGRQLGGAL